MQKYFVLFFYTVCLLLDKKTNKPSSPDKTSSEREKKKEMGKSIYIVTFDSTFFHLIYTLQRLLRERKKKL